MSKPLVYLVDDDPSITLVMEKRFLKYGFEVVTLKTAEDFLEQFKKKKPSIAVIDLNLGEGLNGFDLIRSIRIEYQSNITIIVLSGEEKRDKIAHAIELGANEFIVKPPLRLDFEEIIGRHIQSKNLPEPEKNSFLPVSSYKNRAKLTFRLQIEEIQPYGFTLLSDHLIKKGASFYLLGESLKSVLPDTQQVLVTVIGSSSKVVSNDKVYQIYVELDASQENALAELKSYLNHQNLG